MNKDTVVASIIGFGLGLIAAIALWVVPRILPKSLPTTNNSQQVAESSSSPSTNVSVFDIVSPKDGDITQDQTVTFTGVAPSATLVILSSASANNVLTPEADYKFSGTLSLAEGANEIVVTSITPNKEDSKTLTVYYYPESI